MIASALFAGAGNRGAAALTDGKLSQWQIHKHVVRCIAPHEPELYAAICAASLKTQAGSRRRDSIRKNRETYRKNRETYPSVAEWAAANEQKYWEWKERQEARARQDAAPEAPLAPIGLAPIGRDYAPRVPSENECGHCTQSNGAATHEPVALPAPVLAPAPKSTPPAPKRTLKLDDDPCHYRFVETEARAMLALLGTPEQDVRKIRSDISVSESEVAEIARLLGQGTADLAVAFRGAVLAKFDELLAQKEKTGKILARAARLRRHMEAKYRLAAERSAEWTREHREMEATA